MTILNRAEREDFSAENYMAMQTGLERVMDKTKLKYRSKWEHLTKLNVDSQSFE